MESSSGRDVCIAALELWRFSGPDSLAQRAYTGAGQAGGTDAGAITDLQAAGGDPACRP